MNIYRTPYFTEYLKLSLEIFQKTQYKKYDTHPYKNHVLWNEYITLLKQASVEKIWICESRSLGITYQEYTDIFHEEIAMKSIIAEIIVI